MKLSGLCLALAALACSPLHAAGPLETSSPLYQSIAALDQRLFASGFNDCNVQTLDALVAEDLEFFHDECGITRGKKAFVDSVKTNVCNAGYHATRQLLPETMVLFPLKNNGQLYGVLQKGEHVFLAQEGDGPIRKTSTAHFAHLWLKDGDRWKLARVISYGHLPTGESP